VIPTPGVVFVLEGNAEMDEVVEKLGAPASESASA
jgi:hypothetical protein